MKNNQAIKICMISSHHDLYDDRIYWKEALSLKKFGYDVYCVVISDLNDNGITYQGIHYVKIKIEEKKYGNKIYRKIVNHFIWKKCYIEILKEAKQISADIYHFHDLDINKIGKRLKKLPNNPKIIYDVHEFYPDAIRDYNDTKGIKTIIKNVYANRIDAWELKCSENYDFIITADDATAKRFINILRKEKVGIIYNFSEFNNANFGNKENEEKIYDAVYCGGITKVRGAMKILQAIAYGVSQVHNFRFLFLGSINNVKLKNEMQNFMKQKHIEKNVEFVGSVKHEDVPGYLKKCKIGIVTLLPIPKYYKNIPIKQFEYMTFGLPIVGSDLPPISKFVKEADSGILVDPLNHIEIWEAMIKIINDKDLYNKLSQNGMKAIKQKYNWATQEEKLYSIYKNLTERK